MAKTAVKSTTKKSFVGKAAAKAAKQLSKEEAKKQKAGMAVLAADSQSSPAEGEVWDEKHWGEQPEDHPGSNDDADHNAGGSQLVQASSSSFITGLSTRDLKAALETQTEQRGLIKKFVEDNLVKDVDYIRIHFKKFCTQEDAQPGSCTDDSHFSKRILAKPGQEKIFSLFGLTSELHKDEEAFEMLADRKDLVAYKCIVKRGDQVVAEGRGAAEVGDRKRDVNATIKIAEKRARMDACLALGFSEYFAQDLDDPDYQNQRDAAAAQDAGRAQAADPYGLGEQPVNAPVNDRERQVLVKLMLKAGFDGKDEQLELLRLNGVSDPAKMTSGQARELINKLSKNAFNRPKIEPGDGIDADPDIDINQDPDFGDDPAPELTEPELVIDDELKAKTQELLASVGLTTIGEQWFFRKVSGRPFAKFADLTDDDWRRAWDLLESILSGEQDLERHHLNGGKPSKPKKQTKLADAE